MFLADGENGCSLADKRERPWAFERTVAIAGVPGCG
jgi:hypothetical protein